MNQAILMSIRPQHVCNIFNLIKLLEIRKKFPKNYVGWVYIYCTINGGCITKNANKYTYYKKGYTTRSGKVVARFWCDKVEEILIEPFGEEYKDYEIELCKKSCLSFVELNKYLQGENGYAIHITKLEIFDKPMELGSHENGWQFMKPGFDAYYNKDHTHESYLNWANRCEDFKVRKAPQSWQFIEFYESIV